MNVQIHFETFLSASATVDLLTLVDMIEESNYKTLFTTNSDKQLTRLIFLVKRET